MLGTLSGVENLEKTEVEGGDCWWTVVAAAAVNPMERRAEGKRRKVEENSLKVPEELKKGGLYLFRRGQEWGSD